MLKSLLKPSGSCFHRQLSTLLAKDAKNIKVHDLTHPSVNHDDQEGRIKLVNAIASSSNPNKSELYTQLIPTFGTYFKLAQGDISDEDLLRHLININPGRVLDTFDLLEKHHITKTSDAFKKDVLSKLVKEYTSDVDYSVDRLLEYLNKHFESIEESHFKELFATLLHRQDISQLDLFIANVNINRDTLLKEVFANYTDPLAKFALVRSFERWFKEPESIEPWIYAVILDLLNFQSKQVVPTHHKAGIELDIGQLNQRIINYINGSRIDLQDKNLVLRKMLVETWGISQNDIGEALQVFQKYETFAKYGISNVQISMVKAISYQAIKQDKEIFKTMAETMIPPDLTIQLLQILITLKSYFNPNEGLALYNDYIGAVSAVVKDGSSQKGLLTQSIILGFLMNNDREFASLLFDKAIENRIITDQLEIATIKKSLKMYSDCFVEDENWDAGAREKMKDEILSYIESIGALQVKLLASIEGGL
ncbi:hypothetical protein FOB58_004754 [Candida parapsilosis]|uniref:Uncharacterized protein n=2 Tax=Candida parapsilosis TaxID=5480 RepID=G8BHD6_CANPC|nr:uncharacterized protein CPAR2_500860 [Candida parapsilosis]KAF6044469.1 hypothetical protein FOB58_004754 [Candida parapsilosis]KAF6045146.1 hypothetical protein FOB59_004622 [Candida parapsilosis]KAF6048709.1 hypothetical protein FOB60_004093 [Candida parapsilosis]KAF6060710.1 hypothetical protein FOB61_004719 [Candida parapsilosis]KAI5901014.1 MIOREX complex component 12 [Candida parapsilosis]